MGIGRLLSATFDSVCPVIRDDDCRPPTTTAHRVAFVVLLAASWGILYLLADNVPYAAAFVCALASFLLDGRRMADMDDILLCIPTCGAYYMGFVESGYGMFASNAASTVLGVVLTFLVRSLPIRATR